MRKVDNACKTILEFGILATRECIETGNYNRSEIEIDHIHNLPSLIGDANLRRHLQYFLVDRKRFIKRMDEINDPKMIQYAATYYRPAWNELAEVLLEAFPEMAANS